MIKNNSKCSKTSLNFILEKIGYPLLSVKTTKTLREGTGNIENNLNMMRINNLSGKLNFKTKRF